MPTAQELEAARVAAINLAASKWICFNVSAPLRLRMLRESFQWFMRLQQGSVTSLTDTQKAILVQTWQHWLFQEGVRNEAIRLAANQALTATDANFPTLASYQTEALQTFWSLLPFARKSDLDGKFTLPANGTVNDYIDGTGAKRTFPTIPGAVSTTFPTTPARTIQTVAAAANGWQLSTTKPALVSYSVTITSSVQIGLITNVEGSVVLEIAPTNSTVATDWKEIACATNGQTIGLAVAFSSIQKCTFCLTGTVPPNNFVRLRSIATNGTPTFAFKSGQETLLAS